MEELLLGCQNYCRFLGFWVDGLHNHNIRYMEGFTNIRTVSLKLPTHLQLVECIDGYDIGAFGPVDQLNNFPCEHLHLIIQFQALDESQNVMDKLTSLLMRLNMISYIKVPLPLEEAKASICSQYLTLNISSSTSYRHILTYRYRFDSLAKLYRALLNAYLPYVRCLQRGSKSASYYAYFLYNFRF